MNQEISSFALSKDLIAPPLYYYLQLPYYTLHHLFLIHLTQILEILTQILNAITHHPTRLHTEDFSPITLLLFKFTFKPILLCTLKNPSTYSL